MKAGEVRHDGLARRVLRGGGIMYIVPFQYDFIMRSVASIVRIIDVIRRAVVPRLSPYPITIDLDLYAIPPNFIWQLPHKVMSKQRMHTHTSGKMVSG